MKIFNAIEIHRVNQRHNTLIDTAMLHGFFDAFNLESKRYARLVWLNICELLTDIIEQVNIVIDTANTDMYKAQAFKAFVFTWGKLVWQRLFDDGFAVIGWNKTRFWVMNMNEYQKRNSETNTSEQKIIPNDPNVEVYVMRSPTFLTEGLSDKAVCLPWLDYLDKAMNTSSTVLSRLGVALFLSPKSGTGAPMSAVLTKADKDALEKEIEDNYGALKKQKSVMLLSKEMNAQVINLAGSELRTEERVRRAVLSIADRIKVPANQIGIIDANSSKALSNGNELREGDKAKYKSARRLFERTFVQMGNDLMIKFTYTIDGEPIDSAASSDGSTI